MTGFNLWLCMDETVPQSNEEPWEEEPVFLGLCYGTYREALDAVAKLEATGLWEKGRVFIDVRTLERSLAE